MAESIVARALSRLPSACSWRARSIASISRAMVRATQIPVLSSVSTSRREWVQIPDARHSLLPNAGCQVACGNLTYFSHFLSVSQSSRCAFLSHLRGLSEYFDFFLQIWETVSNLRGVR